MHQELLLHPTSRHRKATTDLCCLEAKSRLGSAGGDAGREQISGVGFLVSQQKSLGTSTKTKEGPNFTKGEGEGLGFVSVVCFFTL